MSFRFKTILGIALIEGLLLLILVSSNLNFLSLSFDTELKRRADTTVRLFAAISQDAVISTDLAALESAVEELLAQSSVLYARVYGQDVLLASGGNAELLQRPFVADRQLAQAHDGIFDTAADIVVGGYTFGRVELGLDVAVITATLEEARRYNILIALSEMLLVAVFSYGLGSYLTRQLASLTHASHEIAAGHIDSHVAVHGNDELAETARAFNHMSDRLQATYGELQQAATFFRHTAEAIMITDADNRIVRVNAAFCRITGYGEGEVLGRDPAMLSSGRHDAAFYREMHRTLGREGQWQGEIWNRRKSGEPYAEWLSIVAIKDEAGKVVQYMSLFSDITRRKQDEEKIWRQANYDAVTALPNRTLFMDRLDQAVQRAHRDADSVALLFIDLDRFKWVNDTLGHAAGDHVLQETSRRLEQHLRESDTVARLGGDEFTVILPGIRGSQDAEMVAEKILESLHSPYALDDREVVISGSVGIALFPQDAPDVEGLLRNADAAMYRAKESGRNVFRFYTQAMNEESHRRMRLEGELQQVLVRDELLLYYQPIVNAAGQVVGAEALLRWLHPELGFIPPDEFIPLAEQSGVIIAIEQWVMRRACVDTRSWHALTGSDFFIAVNVSSMQCKSDVCQHTLLQILAESGLPPGQLKLELTERVMMENSEFVIGLLNEVKAMGVRLAIDDFGTGYSSLSYLKQFPIDVLKIDRAFISGLPGDQEDVALVEAILAMAHSLKLQVVAEGVETPEQLEFLRQRGCDLIQGFYYSRPLPEESFRHYLAEHPRG